MRHIIQTNYLNRNGLYYIEETSPSVIDILPGIQVDIFVLNTKKPITVNLEEGSKVHFYGFFHQSCPAKIFFHQNEKNSQLTISTLFFNKQNNLSSQIKSYINSYDCTSNMNIIGLIDDNTLLLDSVIEIEKNIKNIQANLDIENIFLSQNGSVQSIPTLLVRSDDIQASHSSKTYQISSEDIFYLMSRGISFSQAKQMLILSYFHKTFEGLQSQKELYKNIEELFLSFQE